MTPAADQIYRHSDGLILIKGEAHTNEEALAIMRRIEEVLRQGWAAKQMAKDQALSNQVAIDAQILALKGQ